MDKICPYCRSQHLIKNGSAYGVPKWKCKDCGRQTSFKPPRGEPLWKKETAVLLYTLGLSMNAIAKQLGVSTPSILNWIRAHAATHAPRPQPEPGESVVVMELDELWHFLQKKLGRQSQLLEGALLEGAEVSGRVPAEAGAQDPGVEALFQAGSGFAPFDRIDRRQVLSADWGEAGQCGGEDADGAAHDQAWRGDFAAGGAPLMVALSAEELLQVVVGRRQPRNLQVVEQAGAVAVGDLEEAVDGLAQGAAGIPAAAPSVEQAGVAGLDVIGRAPGRVLQDAGRGMDPAEAPPDVRPQRAGPVQTLDEQRA